MTGEVEKFADSFDDGAPLGRTGNGDAPSPLPGDSSAAATSPSVAEVLAATAGAGTARYDASLVTTGPDVAKHGRTVILGSSRTVGTIQFASGNGASLITILQPGSGTSSHGSGAPQLTTISLAQMTLNGDQYMTTSDGQWGVFTIPPPVPKGSWPSSAGRTLDCSRLPQRTSDWFRSLADHSGESL